MKLSKFDLEKRMSIADMKTIKAGCASCTSGGATCSSASRDADNGSTDSDAD